MKEKTTYRRNAIKSLAGFTGLTIMGSGNAYGGSGDASIKDGGRVPGTKKGRLSVRRPAANPATSNEIMEMVVEELSNKFGSESTEIPVTITAPSNNSSIFAFDFEALDDGRTIQSIGAVGSSQRTDGVVSSNQGTSISSNNKNPIVEELHNTTGNKFTSNKNEIEDTSTNVDIDSMGVSTQSTDAPTWDEWEERSKISAHIIEEPHGTAQIDLSYVHDPSQPYTVHACKSDVSMQAGTNKASWDSNWENDKMAINHNWTTYEENNEGWSTDAYLEEYWPKNNPNDSISTSIDLSFDRDGVSAGVSYSYSQPATEVTDVSNPEDAAAKWELDTTSGTSISQSNMYTTPASMVTLDEQGRFDDQNITLGIGTRFEISWILSRFIRSDKHEAVVEMPSFQILNPGGGEWQGCDRWTGDPNC